MLYADPSDEALLVSMTEHRPNANTGDPDAREDTGVHQRRIPSGQGRTVPQGRPCFLSATTRPAGGLVVKNHSERDGPGRPHPPDRGQSRLSPHPCGILSL